MSSWGTILIASLIGGAHGIPCSDIGWSTTGWLSTLGDYGLLHTATILDPLNPPRPGLWDIVKAEDCWVRFQVPRPGETGRVTKTVFTATPDQVIHTMNSMFGSDGNIMLWLQLGSNAFQYANVYKLSEIGGIQITKGQPSLIKDKTVMSIILPDGAAKLEHVSPGDGRCDQEDMRNIIQGQNSGIIGLRGTIAPGDWAYSTGKEAIMATYMLDEKQKDVPRNKALSVPGWLLAEKADKNCVVIDLTGVVDFAAYGTTV